MGAKKGIGIVLADFVTGFITWNLSRGGKLADEQQAKERMEVCNGCEHKGIVEPLPFVKMVGCTICQCPLKTKTMFKEIPVDGDVTAIKLLKKSGNQIVTCPKNKWAQIDKNYG